MTLFVCNFVCNCFCMFPDKILASLIFNANMRNLMLKYPV